MARLILLLLMTALFQPAPAKGRGRPTSHAHGAHKAKSAHRTHRSSAHPIKRSSSARTAFRHKNPCPATNKTTGPCPGYVIDHKQALKRGGPDTPENMQWQTMQAAKAKDRIE